MLLCIFIGLVSGIISGMGIGGGVILIPALTMLLSLDQHSAQGVNLLYFLPTAVIVLITHVKNKSVETKILPGLIIFGIIGAVAGSLLAIRLDSQILRKLFGAFLLLLGAAEIRKKNEPDNVEK